jgi:UTP--glucose-1-phosphate uridylyltransferase
MDLSTCVIPAAGLGTRFLPATKALAKELLPVLDRPVIEWAAEEAVAAGAEELILVLARGKEAVADHLRPDPALEQLLGERGKQRELAAVRRAGRLARKVTVVYQDEPHGLGHAVLCAADAVGDRPFLCMLPDDLSHGGRPLLQQLVEAYHDTNSAILALARRPEDISRYGCAEIAETRGNRHRVVGLVEKPPKAEAKSDLAVMGRYVLPPSIFDALRATRPGALGEIQLTDGIAALLSTGEVWGVEFEGELLDVGTPAGWLASNFRLAAESEAFRSAVSPEVATPA